LSEELRPPRIGLLPLIDGQVTSGGGEGVRVEVVEMRIRRKKEGMAGRRGEFILFFFTY
jgi:hypothetical protein